MAYSLTIELPGCPLLPNTLYRRHWRSQWNHTTKWRTLVKQAVGNNKPPKPLPFSRVVIYAHRRGKKPDPDNLNSSMKVVRDGLLPDRTEFRKGKPVRHIGADVIEDDQEENFEGGAATVAFVRCKKGERPMTVVTVEEVERRSSHETERRAIPVT